MKLASMRSHLATALMSALLLAGVIGPTSAETITVCAKGCDYTSINAAIAAASNGDVIQLAVETYLEGSPIDTQGKSLIIRGALGSRGEPLSILDGAGSHGVIRCTSGEGNDTALWTRALAGEETLLRRALDRFCLSLGSVTGDLALAHGPGSVVLAGGLGQRLSEILPQSGFAERFAAKGRYEALMAGVPVKIITHPEPGLFGAAAAFAREHSS